MPRVQPEQTRRSQGKHRAAWAIQDNTLKAPWAFKTKEKVICMCEGPGRCCTRENPSKQKEANAIPGLHSSWVGKNQGVLAMARPWQEHIERYHLLDAFQRHNIGMVLNLQEVGEHATCGPGNLPGSGFTYLPESFMAAGIGYYNMCWADMGVPNLGRMMDIVQVMDYVTKVEGRKVAVHCHAGLGRTGLSIACHLVYSEGMTAKRAVDEVRQGRMGALQTRQQLLFVYLFEQYLAYLRRVMPEPANASKKSTKGGAAHTQSEVAPASEADAGGNPAVLATRAEKTKSWPCGLTIVRASVPNAVLVNQVKRARKPIISGADQAVDPGIPWNVETLDIIPEKYDRKWQPRAPRTYQEALHRQQQLLHGPTRSTFMHLHHFLSQLVLPIITAAQAHGSPAPSPPVPAAAALPVPAASHAARPLSPEMLLPHQALTTAAPYPIPASMATGHAPDQELIPTPPASTQIAAVAEGVEVDAGLCRQVAQPGGAGQGTCWTRDDVQIHMGRVRHQTHPPGPVAESAGASAPAQPSQMQGPISCFADALLRCTHGHGQVEQVLEFKANPAYASFAGKLQADASALADMQSQLRAAANFGNYAVVATAPIISLVHTVEELMSQLTAYVPALSKATLVCIRDCYPDLPYSVGPHSEVEQFAAAQKLLEPIPAEDQELLLLFSALLRHSVSASGPGCEEHAKGLCHWVTHLMMGAQLQYANPQAQEAINSFLWYLLRNDVAYASLILARHKRQAGRTRKQAGSKQSDAARVSQNQLAPRLPSLPMMPARMEASSISSLDETLANCQPGVLQQAAGSMPYRPSKLPAIPPHAALHIKDMLDTPPPPLQPPPGKALSPARPGPHMLWQAPNMAVPGQVPGTDMIAGVAHVQGLLMSKGADGQPDPRLYGGGHYEADRDVATNPYAGLKQQLAGIPTAYIPPTTPGTQQVVVHDVWI